MAALSTLRISTPEIPPQSLNAANSHSSSFRSHDLGNSIVHSETLPQSSFSATRHSWAYDPSDDPADTTWYCSSCGDGPYPNWQPSCASCHTNHGHTNLHNNLDAIIDPWSDMCQGPAPSDGEGHTVWFCSNCGDGPYLSWQVSCQKCQHEKCSKCRIEMVK